MFGLIERGNINVDRQQPVLAARLNAVTGIIDDGNIGTFGILGEIAQRPRQLAAAKVDGDCYLKAERPQHVIHLAGVIGGI